MAAASQKPPRRQYRLSELFAWTFCAAAGLALARLSDDWWRWPFGLTAAVSVAAVGGLARQTLDLARAARSQQTDLRRAATGGYLLAIAARLWLAGMLLAGLAGYVLEILEPAGYEAPEFVVWYLQPYEVLLFLPFLVLFSAAYQPAEERRGKQWVAVREALAWCATIAFLLLVLVPSSVTIVCYLVHCAIMGIEQSQSTVWFSAGGAPRLEDLPFHRAEFFFTVSLAAPPVVALGLVLLRRLARTTGGSRGRLALLGLLIIDLLAALAYVIWTYTIGLRDYSPSFAAAVFLWSVRYWVFGLMVFIAAGTMLAWRLADVSRFTPVHWRRPEGRVYLHEGRLAAAVVAAVGLWWACLYIRSAGQGQGSPSYWDIVDFVPFTCWLVAFTWVGVRLLFASPQRRAWSEALGPYDLPLRRFLAVWAASFVLCASGATALTWSSLALWHFLLLYGPSVF